MKDLSVFLQKYVVNERLITLYIVYYLALSFVTVIPLFHDMKPVAVPMYFLVFREFLFTLILGSFVLLTGAKASVLIAALMTALLSLTVLFVAHINVYYLMGIRSLLPVLALFVWPSQSVRYDFLKSWNWTKQFKIILIINIFFQVLHLFFGTGYYAKLAIGLNARNPGLLYYPAASAMFILVMFAAYLKENRQPQARWVFLFTAAVLLCSSVTGIIGLLVLCIYHLSRVKFDKKVLRNLVLVTFFGLVGLVFLHFGRSSMNGPVYYLESSTGRIKILNKAISTMEFLPVKFGYFTNVAAKGDGGFMPDSFYTAFLGNLGIVWSVLFGLFLIYGVLRNYQAKQSLLFILLFLVGAFSINMTETGAVMLLIILFKTRYSQIDDDRELYGSQTA